MKFKKILVAMGNILLLIASLHSQTGISVFILERPEGFVFDSPDDFTNGVSAHMTLAISTTDSFGPYNLLVSASGDLDCDGRSIPISTISVKAKKAASCRGNKKVFLSNHYQCIARNPANRHSSGTENVELELEANGGGQYMRPAGKYSAYITFTLVQD